MGRNTPKTRDPDFRQYVPFMGRDYNMFMLLGLVLAAILRARHRQVDGLGITPAEFHVLLLVEKLKEAASPAEISRWMMRRPATISRLLDRMEKGRLVRRVRHPTNEKTKQVVMSPKGKVALDRARTPDVIRSLMRALSEAEFRQLWLLLEKLKAGALRTRARTRPS